MTTSFSIAMKNFSLTLLIFLLLENPVIGQNCTTASGISAFEAVGTALSCNNNVFTPPNSGSIPQDVFDNNSRAVFMMKIKDPPGVSGCTCTLLRQAFNNNDDNQQENIFITSRHCIVKNAFNPSNSSSNLLDFQNAIFIFNFSNPDASTTTNITSKSCRYVLEGGATLIDIDYATDVAVLRLNNPIPPHFKPYYAGWSALPFSSFSGMFFDIHHAALDIKKISSAPFGGVTQLISSLVPRYHVTWTNGVIEGGSSGSGLLNFNRRLIGVLSGSFPATSCVTGLSANFGKFNDFWLTNSATRGKLNPDNIFGLADAPGGEIECYNGDLFLTGNYWPAGDYQPNNSITIKTKDNIYLGGSASLIVYPGSDFTFEAQNVIKLNPGTSVSGQFKTVLNSSCTAMRTASESYDIDSSIVQYYRNDNAPGNSTLTTERLPLIVSPNPNNGIFALENKSRQTESGIIIRDCTGKLVYEGKLKNNQKIEMNFEFLQSGIYMLEVNDLAGSKRTKLAINK